MPLVTIGSHKPPIEVVDDVRGAPIELGGDGRHVGRKERGPQHASPSGREKVAHHHHVPGFLVRQPGIQHQRRQPDDDPGPWAEAVVRDREPERREERVALIARRHHALRDIAAASRLLTWIPAGPPLHADVGEEGSGRERQGRTGGDAGADTRHEFERRCRQRRT